MSADCPLLGEMPCVCIDKGHDPTGPGHQYQGSSVPDGHDITEEEAERSRG